MKIINIILHNKLYQNLILSVCFSAIILITRIFMTHSFMYLFLVWNLFLASIPFLMTQFIKYHYGNQIKSHRFWLLFFVWLLFFPNAPYIITDFIHLRYGNPTLFWGDLFLVFAFAINGLLLGILSMIDIYRFAKTRMKKGNARLLIICSCFLSGFGIYIGRILRFNSWDIVSKPMNLVSEVFFNLDEPIAWLMTLTFGGLIWICFQLFRSLGTTNR